MSGFASFFLDVCIFFKHTFSCRKCTVVLTAYNFWKLILTSQGSGLNLILCINTCKIKSLRYLFYTYWDISGLWLQTLSFTEALCNLFSII